MLQDGTERVRIRIKLQDANHPIASPRVSCNDYQLALHGISGILDRVVARFSLVLDATSVAVNGDGSFKSIVKTVQRHDNTVVGNLECQEKRTYMYTESRTN